MTDTKTYVRCSGSGRRALRSLMDQNRQQCPVCNRYNWLTPAGYHPAHPADDTERPATGTCLCCGDIFTPDRRQDEFATSLLG